jgi:ribulose 1,5-bisphosphate carboxylase large subunit-like protein
MLCLSPKTIYTYRYRLYSLFGVDNDVELAHVAIKYGIVGHPGGPAAGVRAITQAWEAAKQGISLETYAKSNRELAQSLEKFGGMQI